MKKLFFSLLFVTYSLVICSSSCYVKNTHYPKYGDKTTDEYCFGISIVTLFADMVHGDIEMETADSKNSSWAWVIRLPSHFNLDLTKIAVSIFINEYSDMYVAIPWTLRNETSKNGTPKSEVYIEIVKIDEYDGYIGLIYSSELNCLFVTSNPPLSKEEILRSM